MHAILQSESKSVCADDSTLPAADPDHDSGPRRRVFATAINDPARHLLQCSRSGPDRTTLFAVNHAHAAALRNGVRKIFVIGRHFFA
jgi:hypothetical protein